MWAQLNVGISSGLPSRPETLQVGVRFDEAIPGGTDLGGSCAPGHGAYCVSAELAREQEEESAVDGELLARLQALREVISRTAAAGPLIVLYKVRKQLCLR